MTSSSATNAPRPERSLRIAHLYPELLNLYGDSGNILVLRKRMEWRGITAVVREVHVGDTPSFADVDIAFIGGGSDREQKIVCDFLLFFVNYYFQRTWVFARRKRHAHRIRIRRLHRHTDK